MAIEILDLATEKAEHLYQWIKTVDLIPASAIVAIILFFTRECLESQRKKESKNKELSALKLMIARECELNWCCIDKIDYICNKFEPYERDPENCPYKFSIEIIPTGRVNYFLISNENPQDVEGGVINEVHSSTLSKHLFDLAKLDSHFYELAQNTYDSICELEHLRMSIIDMPHTKKLIGDVEMMLGFSGYALGEIEEIRRNILPLYKYCTGKDSITGRLR